MSATTNNQTFSIKFWGVRGSYPVPGTQTLHYGGNTTCVEVRAGHHTIILDAGTGIIGLGRELMGRLRQTGQPIEATLLFSHLHHDHTQGFPFFTPAFVPTTRLNLFGTAILEHALEDVLSSTMSPPTFPITLSEMGSVKAFYGLRDTDVVWLDESVGGVLVSGPTGPGTPAGEGANVVKVRCLRSYAHPGGVMLYRIEWGGHALVYATDTEGYVGGDRRLVNFARGADLLIHDAQYAEEHYNGQLAGFPATQGWGHSTASMACEVARAAGIRQLVLTHHEPQYDDEMIHVIEARARQDFSPEAGNVVSAYEGLEIIIGDGTGNQVSDCAGSSCRQLQRAAPVEAPGR